MTQEDSGRRDRLGRLAGALWPYLAASLLVVVTVAVVQALAPVAWVPHISVLFLGCVLAAAVPWGIGPSLLAVILAMAASAYFFFPPIYSLAVDHPQDLVDLSAFSAIALILSQQTARIRRQAAEAHEREKVMADIYAFSRKVAGIVDREDLIREILAGLRGVIGDPIALIVPEDDGSLRLAQGAASPEIPGSAILSAARELMASPLARGLTLTIAGNPWQLHPVRGTGQVVAILAIGNPRSTEASPLTAGLLDRTGLAFERSDFARTVETAKVRARADELREALVNSVSHDLKTPLTSIVGSATALREEWSLYDEPARRDLVATIHEEAMRLDHVVGNAIELARLRSGEAKPHREATEMADVVNAAVAGIQRVAPDRAIRVDIPGDLPMLDLDPFLAERALVQILENAAKYSPTGTPIHVIAHASDAEVAVEVSDEGVGFAIEEAPLVFDRFYRAVGEDVRIAGTGLGLAIARAFVEADGGTVAAESDGPGRGATFRIAYPVSMTQLASGDV